MTSLFVFFWRNRMVCFGSRCLAERQAERRKQPRQAHCHGKVPRPAMRAKALGVRERVLHTVPCQVDPDPEPGTSRGPSRLSLGTKVARGGVLCGEWVFLRRQVGSQRRRVGEVLGRQKHPQGWSGCILVLPLAARENSAPQKLSFPQCLSTESSGPCPAGSIAPSGGFWF